MPVTQALLEGAWYATVTEIDDDSTLNLRAAPDISAEIVMKLYKNQKLMVLEECPQEDWVHVRTDAAEGYVMKKFLTRESDAQATP
jgi:SH3-like domain-containing protein